MFTNEDYFNYMKSNNIQLSKENLFDTWLSLNNLESQKTSITNSTYFGYVQNAQTPTQLLEELKRFLPNTFNKTDELSNTQILKCENLEIQIEDNLNPEEVKLGLTKVQKMNVFVDFLNEGRGGFFTTQSQSMTERHADKLLKSVYALQEFEKSKELIYQKDYSL